MYICSFNLHFPGGSLRERAALTASHIRDLPSPCLVLLQEACSTTARAIASGTQTTHSAFYRKGSVAPFLLTLVPLSTHARVRFVSYPPGLTRMRRTAHLVELPGARGPPHRPFVVAHVHLESCASSASLRDAQAAWLRTAHGACVLAGDLNGLDGWRTHVVVAGENAPSVRCERIRVSPHTMCLYDLSPKLTEDARGAAPRAL
jgi:hypothetical protein